jgi:predicted O-methyltransferase YrrM
METAVPGRVRTATKRAEAAGFTMSCDPHVGQLLGVLAATSSRDGRILELGTGTGVGLAWIVEGLGSRADVEVVSVEMAPDIAAFAASSEWPDFVKLEVGDALEFIGQPERYDLIFADAQGGKWEGLEQTIDSLRPGGLLLVDDMEPTEYMNDEHRVKTVEVRERLLASEHIAHVELNWATGLILCARRFDHAAPSGASA